MRESEVLSYLQKNNLFTNLVKKAFEQAKVSHDNQYRLNGKSYFEDHILQVVSSLVECTCAKVSEEAVAASLLHDCLEDDPEMNEQMLSSFFPKKVVDMVKALTKSESENSSKLSEDEIVEINKKVVSRIRASSREVQLIKLADRYSNILHIEEIKRSHPLVYNRFLSETKKLFLPFACDVSPFFYQKMKKVLDRNKPV